MALYHENIPNFPDEVFPYNFAAKKNLLAKLVHSLSSFAGIAVS